jgi:hypothetical protein
MVHVHRFSPSVMPHNVNNHVLKTIELRSVEPKKANAACNLNSP